MVKPLTTHGFAMLRRLTEAPVPKREVNPGLFDKLVREGLAKAADHPSQFGIKGQKTTYLEITPAGMSRLEEEPRHVEP